MLELVISPSNRSVFQYIAFCEDFQINADQIDELLKAESFNLPRVRKMLKEILKFEKKIIRFVTDWQCNS